jgi:tubulin monoglycylase TTLL3/8
LRFSSQTYNLRKLHESIHLTNNSVQCKYKNTSLDSALPSYNMWDSNDFVRYLTNIGYPNTFKETVYPGMKQCITAAVLMHQDKMVVRKNCFELYGADFILTEDFQPWLLEINSNPALYGSTPVTARMCPKVLEDVIKGGFHQHCSPIADHKV